MGSGWYPGLQHELLRPYLARLKACRDGAWPEDLDARGAKRVRRARGQGQFRPYDSDFYALCLGKACQRGRIG